MKVEPGYEVKLKAIKKEHEDLNGFYEIRMLLRGGGLATVRSVNREVGTMEIKVDQYTMMVNIEDFEIVKSTKITFECEDAE